VAVALGRLRREAGIHVFLSLKFCVAPRCYRVPDIAVTTHKIPKGILRESPFLCVEVLSPEDRMSRLDERVDDFLAIGVKYIWLVAPRRKKAWIYTSEGRREATNFLTTSSPDLALPLEEIFTALDEDIESE